MTRITNVRRSDAGNYSLSINNSINPLVSSDAILRVRVRQRLHRPQITENGWLGVRFGDEDGGLLSMSDVSNFTVQGSTDLLHWVLLTNRIEALPEGDHRGRADLHLHPTAGESAFA